jgi:uncharacterized cupin superfamily protein
MSYHRLNSDELTRCDDRPTDVRSLSVAAGSEYQNSTLGLHVYELSPGDQSGVAYHAREKQVKAFYVLEGTFHVETPNDEYAVEAD